MTWRGPQAGLTRPFPFITLSRLPGDGASASGVSTGTGAAIGTHQGRARLVENPSPSAHLSQRGAAAMAGIGRQSSSSHSGRDANAAMPHLGALLEKGRVGGEEAIDLAPSVRDKRAAAAGHKTRHIIIRPMVEYWLSA
jgi:hypothetical protein